MRKLAVFLLLTLAALPARAEREWYGWQIFLVDAGSIGLGIATRSGALAGSGYLLGGPIVHLAHGDNVEAAVDLGLRAALPLGGALLGGAGEGCSGDCDGPGGGLIVGGIAAGATALIVDYLFLSTHETGTGASFTPEKGGGVLSIAGRF